MHKRLLGLPLEVALAQLKAQGMDNPVIHRTQSPKKVLEDGQWRLIKVNLPMGQPPELWAAQFPAHWREGPDKA